MSKWSAFNRHKKTGSIRNQLDSAHKKKSKQGLYFRGHREDELPKFKQRNFKEACMLIVDEQIQ
ncbi:zinc finger MYM-type protein 1-like isoform X3 [Aphis craccivora]|uniref:Zinc finger MYM-type protein 1-like isoform X3 n=1 Tax=Aphis craccivora TaxID=307492 RepID=A0A6G0YFN7_APHCR|nr:zinc finger MYM-type protein 1-like isoform X3 [Aphis craccivora]